MCGIFGYAGASRDAAQAVLEGLQRLDYRGYDSWGVSVLGTRGIATERHTGVVGKRTRLPRSSAGIGHTRWATHGAVTKLNAHPHTASDGSFVLAHNGIVENVDDLQDALRAKGYPFHSQTDTEIIVRLIEEKRASVDTLDEAVRLAFKELAGRNTVIVLARDGAIVAARNGSPLVLGFGTAKELYLSSDVFSAAPHVKTIAVLDNGQMVSCAQGAVTVRDATTGKRVPYTREKNTLRDVSVHKGRYPHFMLKEIHEAPFVIRQVLGQKRAYEALARTIRRARRVYCIGSGTAGVAAAQIAYYLRAYGNIPAIGLVGAEATEYEHLIGTGDVIIAPSQSGETADVLEVLERARAQGATIASFVNMPGSAMTRMSDHAFMAHAGPEICVMSTKIFVSQLAWGYLVAKTVQGRYAQGVAQLRAAADTIRKYLADKPRLSRLQRLASRLAKQQHIFLLGKGQNLQVTREAMVKMIEGAYIHAHAIPAGDLKHYAITLMEPGTTVIAIVSDDAVRSDVATAIHEVRARGARVIEVAHTRTGHTDSIEIPGGGEVSAIVNIVPLQLLAYRMAATLGHNVDKPRNIAKSVTVK